MIVDKVYKIIFEEEISLIKRVNRANIEEAFDVYGDDDAIEEIAKNAKPGFLNDSGKFLTPEEALVEALECNQISEFTKKVIEVNNIKRLQKSFLNA